MDHSKKRYGGHQIRSNDCVGYFPSQVASQMRNMSNPNIKIVGGMKRGRKTKSLEIARSSISTVTYESPEIGWDNLGFNIEPTDYMYSMKCAQCENFTKDQLQHFGNIELSPSTGVLNYGQGLFEGLKAYRKHDGKILLFRPEENALRMRMGAERMCMPAPTVEQFVEAVKQTVLANKRWIPPPAKGSLYVRPLLLGSGVVLGLSPALEYTFLTYASPVGNYFKEGLAPINLIVETDVHRATPGGTGGVKTIENYVAVNPCTGACFL